LPGIFTQLSPNRWLDRSQASSSVGVGDYRVIYQPDREKKALIVQMLGHRREIDDRST